MASCKICPRHCNIDRMTDTGSCNTKWNPVVSSAVAHRGEEPPISGTRGSGTVFFAGCNLQCVFCQNYDISQFAKGTIVTTDELADIFLALESRGVHNINLVTPSHIVPQIVEAIVKSKKQGIKLPFIYNTGGYDRVDSLQSLDGLIDIYMPDMKYASDALGLRYSNVPDYFTVASKAIQEMYRQVGKPLYENGVMQKGLFIRHLVLPSLADDSIAVLEWIKENTPLAGISLMAQYTAQYRAIEYSEINRRLISDEYRLVYTHLKKIVLHEVEVHRM